MDFEVELKHWFKKNYYFRFSKSMKFPFHNAITYCPKLDFEADPNNKSKAWIKKTIIFDFKINYISFITQLEYCQNFHFEADPINKFKINQKPNFF